MEKDISLKEQIYMFASPSKFINGGEFERLALDHGYKSSNADRRCRELVEQNRFDKRIINGTVWYRRKQNAINGIEPFAPKKLEQSKLL